MNLGLDICKGEYIARMDADDISLPERIKLQVEFMENNKEIGVCGTCYELFGSENIQKQLPLVDEDIKANLLFLCVICHPSSIIRTEVLKKNDITFGVPFEYKDGLGHKILELEDFGLWHKLKSVTKFANLNKVLLRYRVEGQNLTSKRLDVILERKKQFYFHQLKEINVIPDEMNLLLHISFKYIAESKSSKDIYKFKEHLSEIVTQNKEHKIYNQESLEKYIVSRWENLFYFLPDKKYNYVFLYLKISKRLTVKQMVYLMKITLNKYILRKQTDKN